MPSVQFKKTFAIRFVSYFLIILSSIGITFEFGPLVQAETDYRWNKLFNIQHKVADAPLQNQVITSAGVENTGSLSLGSIKTDSQSIIPVSTDYGIVIEKINANAKVIAEVDPTNERQYVQALSVGVAEALGSTKPGQKGNLFIFSHSADAPWNIIRFNAIFYLLRELEKGDRVLIFYQSRRYDYIVFDKTITEPTDVSFYKNRYDKPVLTLQTCDPPGTLNHRLIVRAQLLGS